MGWEGLLIFFLLQLTDTHISVTISDDPSICEEENTEVSG